MKPVALLSKRIDDIMAICPNWFLTFACKHLANFAHTIIAASVLDHFVPSTPAILVTSILIALLGILQVWFDLFDYEPVTMAAYQRFSRLTGLDPRQTGVTLEHKVAPLCEALNMQDKTETIFSCQGHFRCFFQEYIPHLHWVGIYVMFRTGSMETAQNLAEFLYNADLNNPWALTAWFRPSFKATGQDMGGDFVWLLKSQRVTGLPWQKRSRLDQYAEKIRNVLIANR